MKLLTYAQTKRFYQKFSYFSVISPTGHRMNQQQFNEAVNALLMDAKIVKSLRVQAEIKRDKENVKDIFDEIDSDLENSGMDQGEIFSIVNFFKKKYIIFRK